MDDGKRFEIEARITVLQEQVSALSQINQFLFDALLTRGVLEQDNMSLAIRYMESEYIKGGSLGAASVAALLRQFLEDPQRVAARVLVQKGHSGSA
jgi:hypothetical protein